MEIKLKKLNDEAKIPERGSDFAAGYDLFANISEETEILPHETKLIGTGISCAIPEGYFGGIFARSGLSLKEGLRPANCVGVIDADYRGEIKVALRNHSGETFTVAPGDRIAQMVISPVIAASFEVVDELDDTERASGGFGSTGVK